MNLTPPAGKQINYKPLIALGALVALPVSLYVFTHMRRQVAVAHADVIPYHARPDLSIKESAQHPLELFHASATPTPTPIPRAAATPCAHCGDAVNDYLKRIETAFPDHRNTYEAPQVLGARSLSAPPVVPVYPFNPQRQQ